MLVVIKADMFIVTHAFVSKNSGAALVDSYVNSLSATFLYRD